MSASSSSSPYDRSQSKRRRIEENEDGSRHDYVSSTVHHEEQGTSHQEYERNNIQDQARAHFGNMYKAPVTQNFYGKHTQISKDSDEPTLMAALRFDQMDERHASISKAHTKTCRWLLARQEYIEWREADKLEQHHGFLWIKGKPGAGKSTMMKYILDHDKHSRKEGSQISFFFNARGSALERSVEGMYRSLILQMLEVVPRRQSILADRHCNLREGATLSVGLLKEIFSHLVLNLGRDCMTCYIDALDECDVNQIRDDVVYFFRDLAEETVPLHTQFFVCFSSRHYPQVSLKMCKEIILEEQDEHEQDIANYIKHGLHIGKSRISQEIIAEVQNKADGVFLWVVLVIPMLNEEYDRGRMHALQRRLRETPTLLSKLFQEILTRGSACKDEVLLSLNWIAFARRPLRSEELYYGIMSGIDPKAEATLSPSELSRDDMIRYIVDCTRGLAKATRGKEPVIQFIHETVKEYLVQGSGLAQLDHATRDNAEAHGHNRVKECCENYIGSVPITHQALNQPLPKAKSDEAKQLRQNICSEFPLLEYAVENVIYHANAGQALGISQQSFVQQFPSFGAPGNIKDWNFLNDLLEQHEVRRYENSPRKYIFADRGLDHLLTLAFDDDSTATQQAGRHHTPLCAAVANQSIPTIRVLLGQPEYQPIPLDAFQLAIKQRSTDALKMLVEHAGFQPLTSLSANDRARLVLLSNNPEMLNYLLDNPHDGDSDLKDYSKFASGTGPSLTLLYKALQLKLWDISAVLVERDASIALKWSSLMEVSRTSLDKDVLSLSESRNISISKKLLDDLLCAASARGDLDTVSALLSKGAHVNPKIREDFLTALGVASGKGHLEVVRLLLRNGADVNAQLCESKPLALAAHGGHLLVVHLLLEANADVEAINRNVSDGYVKGDALYMACSKGHTDVALLLLDHGGFDVNTVCIAGNYIQASLLYWASTDINPDTVKGLLERGAEVNSDICRWLEAQKSHPYLGQFSEQHAMVIELLTNAQVARLSARLPAPSIRLDANERGLAQEEQSVRIDDTNNRSRPREMSVAWLLSSP